MVPPQERSLGLTRGHRLPEQDGVGHEDQQQRQVRGDVVGDGVLQVPLTPAGGNKSFWKRALCGNIQTFLESEIRAGKS